jgi:hypothetical protein
MKVAVVNCKLNLIKAPIKLKQCYNQLNYFTLRFKIMNLTSFNANFARILLLSTALVVSINTIAGGRSSGHNLMDDYLQNKTSTNPDAFATPSQRPTLISNNAIECF